MGMLDDLFMPSSDQAPAAFGSGSGGAFGSGGVFGGQGTWNFDPSALGALMNKNSGAMADAGMQFFRNRPQMQMPAVQPLNIPVNQPRQAPMNYGTLAPWAYR